MVPSENGFFPAAGREPVFLHLFNPLPIIRVMPDTGVAYHYQIAMKQFFHKVHRDLPPTQVWGFGAAGSAPSCGKAWPYLEVEPRRYRFRFLNACNSRILNLSLDSRQPIFQIGSDGGFLPRVVEFHSMLIAPAERADAVIDFTGMGGATITLVNDARTPYVKASPLIHNLPAR